MKFTKVAAGHYVTADGRYAVIIDGYTGLVDFEEGTSEGFQGGEWAACFDGEGRLREDHQAGITLEWFPTKRQAVAFCQRDKFSS